MTQTPTKVLGPKPADLAQAVEIWRGGGLVAFPTETVYGLGADARNGQAVCPATQPEDQAHWKL